MGAYYVMPRSYMPNMYPAAVPNIISGLHPVLSVIWTARTAALEEYLPRVMLRRKAMRQLQVQRYTHIKSMQGSLNRLTHHPQLTYHSLLTHRSL